MGRAICIGMVLALLATGASGQKLYRCGNNYQDRPCADGQKGKVVGTTGIEPATGPVAAPSGASALCAQRGKDSLRISWARDGGATIDRLLSEAKTTEERRLVQDVWRRSGGAAQVQAAVEADCNVEMKKQEEAAALAAEAARARGEAGLPPESAAAAVPAPAVGGGNTATQERRPQQSVESDAARRRKDTCDRLSARIDDLRARERAGGTQARLDQFNDQRRRLREETIKAGC